MEENGIPKHANVYAELGSTWRYLMRDPDSAAHTIGKLIKHVGESNVLYGSDCIWYGSPQDQIQAFRTFQISEALQEAHGYAPMTPELRARIFGLNAAKAMASTSKRCVAGAHRPRRGSARLPRAPGPHFLTFGPKTRRQFLANLKARGGSP